jgi:hypothetical protein
MSSLDDRARAAVPQVGCQVLWH